MQQPGSAKKTGRSQTIVGGAGGEAWARLRLVQGESSAQSWDLVQALGHSMLSIGSDASCSWVIKGQGVLPVHFSLHWDGSALRVADTHRAGNVSIDAVPVGAEWQPVSGFARITFGQAEIVVETSLVAARDSGHPLDHLGQGVDVPQTGTHLVSQSGVAPKSPIGQGTLLGVAPLTGQGAPLVASVPTLSSSAKPVGATSHEPSDTFRPWRASDSARPMKPTLVGLTPAPAPTSATQTEPMTRRPALTMNQTVQASDPEQGSAYAFRSPSQRVSGGLLSEGDQRTIQGFPATQASEPGVMTVSVAAAPSSVPPGRRVTQRGLVSVQPGVVPGAVMQVRVKPISDPAPSGTAHDSRPSPGFGAAPTYVVKPASPTQTRQQSAADTSRTRRPFPWHYVGLGMLTLVAYVGWLYLLEQL